MHSPTSISEQPYISTGQLPKPELAQTPVSQARDLRSSQKQREVRGKAEARGGSFPGTVDRPLHRKQLFAAALNRMKRKWRASKS